MTMTAPGCEVTYWGRQYRFGAHGKLFVWDDFEWVLSFVDKKLILTAIRQKEKSRLRSAKRRASEKKH